MMVLATMAQGREFASGELRLDESQQSRARDVGRSLDSQAGDQLGARSRRVDTLSQLTCGGRVPQSQTRQSIFLLVAVCARLAT